LQQNQIIHCQNLCFRENRLWTFAICCNLKTFSFASLKFISFLAKYSLKNDIYPLHFNLIFSYIHLHINYSADTFYLEHYVSNHTYNLKHNVIIKALCYKLFFVKALSKWLWKLKLTIKTKRLLRIMTERRALPAINTLNNKTIGKPCVQHVLPCYIAITLFY